jgi:arylsulfatase A-like enzyme
MLNITPTEQIAGKSFWRRHDLLFWLKKTLSGNDPPNYNYSETGGEVGLKTVITPQWKYIYNYELQTDQLYNIRSDSLELNNLVDAEPKQRDQLKEKLFTWVIRSKKYPPKKETYTLSKEDR